VLRASHLYPVNHKSAPIGAAEGNKKPGGEAGVLSQSERRMINLKNEKQ
jgi:hypothetical protein